MEDGTVRPRLTLSDATTILDLVGLVAVAGGVAYGLWPYLHGFVIAVAGGILLAGSAFAAWRGRPAPTNEQRIARLQRLEAKQLRRGARRARFTAARRWVLRLPGDPA